MTERQPSELIRDYGSFELRRYPAHELVEVESTGDFLSAGSRAFRPLVNYISGKNTANASIPMTAPVAQTALAEDRYLVTFVLPAGTDPAKVPAPRDSSVRTRHVEEYEAAVVGYSGSWSEKRYAEIAAALQVAIAEAGLTPAGEVIFARFDGPWKPGFLKYNEVIQPVTTSVARETSAT
jgi:hypothetical protein